MHDISALETRLLSQLDGFFDGEGAATRAFDETITNIDRTFGARMSYEVSIRHGEAGLPSDRALSINLTGAAGQSFCAFLAAGLTVRLTGEANDYVGKVRASLVKTALSEWRAPLCRWRRPTSAY